MITHFNYKVRFTRQIYLDYVVINIRQLNFFSTSAVFSEAYKLNGSECDDKILVEGHHGALHSQRIIKPYPIL